MPVQLKVCRNCGHEIRVEMSRCPHCDADVTERDPRDERGAPGGMHGE